MFKLYRLHVANDTLVRAAIAITTGRGLGVELSDEAESNIDQSISVSGFYSSCRRRSGVEDV